MMFTYPYQILKLKIATDVPELKEIDWYLQQDSASDKNTWIYTAPTLYIEFLPPAMRDLGGRIQSAEVDFNVHLLTENMMDNERRVKKDQATDHMRIFDKVYKTLFNFSSKLSYLPDFAALLGTSQDQRVMNSISRVDLIPPHAIRKALMKSTQRFRCIIWDHAACKLYTKVTPELEIDVDLDYNLGIDFESFDDSFDDSFE